MKRIFIALLVLSSLIASDCYATKLLELKVVDKDYLLVIFRDGEVFYRDNASGSSAYRGHDFAPGDDTLKAYGNELLFSSMGHPKLIFRF